jgi:dynactin 1
MPQTIDLSKMPENKLAWRPAKESSRWKVEKRKEEWEMWKDWRKEVVLKGSGRAEIV